MSKLVITHNGGFFSCCTIRLLEIVDHFNTFKCLPDLVDSSKQFELYKEFSNIDISNYYFSNNENIHIEYIKNIKLRNDNIEEQFSDYKSLNLSDVSMFLEKYFNLSEEVKIIIKTIETKYNINYEKTLSVFYRGNDKIKETLIAPYDFFISKIKECLYLNKYERILIQTDDELFLKYCLEDNIIKNKIFYFNELARIDNNHNLAIHNLINKKHRQLFGAYFLAATYILSKTKGLITHSGNCGLWAVLFRNNTTNFYQCLNNEWY